MAGLVIVPNIPVVEEVGSGGTLVSSTVPETDYSAWSAGTAYSLGQRVIYAHGVYQRLVAGTTATAPSADTVNWAYVRPTNRYACFDTSNSTATTLAGTISMVIQPGRAVNCVGVIGATGASVRVRIVDPSAGTTYDQTRSLNNTNALPTWYSYFFDARSTFTQFIAQPQAYSSTAQVLIDIAPATTGAGAGTASVATVVIGVKREYTVGVQYGVRLGIVDYSVKQTNTYGDTVLVQRSFSKRAEFQCLVSSSKTDSLYALLSSLRATPALWIVSDQFEASAIYGYLKDWGVSLSMPNEHYLDIQLEGLA